MSSVQVQFTGQGQYPLDIKVNEDLSIRETLQAGAAPTVLPVSLTQLEGNTEWDALRARSDISVTLTSTDRQRATFLVELVDGTTTGADDVSIQASLGEDWDILTTELIVTTVVAAQTVTLRDAAGGAGNALSSALSSAALGRVEDDGALGVPTAVKGTGLFARRTHDGIEGFVRVEALRRS
jgi:hypothetical protein